MHKKTTQRIKSLTALVYLIDDDRWMQMLKVRNQLAHDYDGSFAEEQFSTIVNEYYPLFEKFRIHVEKYYKES